MKNKLLKLSIISLMAMGLVACSNDSGQEAVASDENIEVSKNIDTSDDNKKIDSLQNTENESETKEETSKEDKNTDNSEEKKDDQAKPATIEAKKTDAPKEENEIKEDGSYVSSFIAEAKGEPNEYMSATLYDVEIKKDEESKEEFLQVAGSLDYRKDVDKAEEIENIENKEDHKFKITNQTVYQAVGGMADPEIFSKEEFLKYCKEVKDSGLALIIEVEDGVVKTVSISS